MIIDFYNRNGGGGGGDATVLEPKTSIPSSGAAGTLIATNLAEHQEWQTLEDFTTSGWTAVRGLCSEDTWLNVRFDGHENRYNGSFNGSEWINGGPEEWYSGWNVTWDGNNWTATNNDWLSVSGTTDGDTWQIDFSIATSGVNDGWDIPSNTEVYLTIPQTVGLYQANSAGTYVNALGKAEYAEEADYAREATAASWGLFIRNVEGQPWQDLHHNYEQRENDMFFQGNLLQINKNGSNIPLVFDERNIPTLPLAPVSATPVTADEGIVYAVQNSGETAVKQAIGASGYTFIPYEDGNVGYYGIKAQITNGFFCIVGIGENGAEVPVHLFWDATNEEWDFSGEIGNYWNITTTDTQTFTATDKDGNGYTLNAYVDNGYVYCEFSVPVTTHYGVQGIDDMRMAQTVYQTAVMSKQGLSQIVKLSQAEYDALTTKDVNTIYVIL